MANYEASRRGANNEDIGKLILRLTLGVLVLFHGVAKLTGGNGFVAGALLKAGLPPALGYAVYVGEVLAPLLLIAGVWSRAAALLVAVNMVVAVMLTSTGHLFSISNTGGYALELEAMFLFTAVALALMGAGRYSVAGPRGRWN